MSSSNIYIFVSLESNLIKYWIGEFVAMSFQIWYEQKGMK